jgi:hypothetical protein
VTAVPIFAPPIMEFMGKINITFSF